jgi:hypothetical protein
MYPVRRVVLLVAVAALGVSACDDGPIRSGLTPTLENIWPSEDGRRWDFSMTSRTWLDGYVDTAYVYPDSASVPDAPGLSEILEWFRPDAVPPVQDIATRSFRLEFDGERTTQSGVTGQNLTATIMGGALPGTTLAFAPTFLRDGVWEKTEDWIGSYGDVDTLLSWIYLKPNLSPGASFTFRSRAGWVMDAWVVDWETADTPVGSFQNAVEVIYRMSWGITCRTTVFDPQPHGCYRIVHVGRVIYAPTIGPVYLYERAPAAGDPRGWGFGDVTLELTGLTAGAS